METEITGAEAYTATLSGTTLSLTPCENGVVPGKTGVILIGNTASATATPKANTLPKSQGELIGVAEKAVSMSKYFANNVSAADKVFTLAKEGDQVAFYKYTGTTLAAKKAYLYSETLAGSAAPIRIEITPTNPIVTDIKNTQIVKASKILMDGNLYVVRGAHTYNLNGKIVK